MLAYKYVTFNICQKINALKTTADSPLDCRLLLLFDSRMYHPKEKKNNSRCFFLLVIPTANLPASGGQFTGLSAFPPFRFPRVHSKNKKAVLRTTFPFLVTPTGIEPMIPP